MYIYAERGHKVVAKHLDWGWDWDKEKARKHLEQDKEYTVAYTIVHSSSSEVFLIEVPNISFNSVHFIDVPNNKFEPICFNNKCVGYGFKCVSCKHHNQLVDEDNETQYCNRCGKINIFESFHSLVDFE